MYDTGRVIIGIVVFLGLVASPFVVNLMSSESPQVPELEGPPNGATECIMETQWMRANHMDLLNQWRDEVVRENQREFVIPATGEKISKSLTLTCLKCHSNRSEFCQRCHDYMAVSPYCWDCHVIPQENKEGV